VAGATAAPGAAWLPEAAAAGEAAAAAAATSAPAAGGPAAAAEVAAQRAARRQSCRPRRWAKGVRRQVRMPEWQMPERRARSSEVAGGDQAAW